MLSGVGQLRVVTKTLDQTPYGQNIFFPGLFVDFSYEIEIDTKKARAWIDGRKKVVSSARGDEDNTVKLAFEFLNWDHLAFAEDEIPQNVDRSIPLWKSTTVQPDGIIEDTDLMADNASTVLVYLNSAGSWGQARPLKVGAMDDFQVDHVAQTIAVDTGFAGASVTYQIYKDYTGLPSLGAADEAVSYGNLEFWGKGYGPEFPNGILIHLHDITRTTQPSLVTDDVPKFEIEFTANTPPGKRKPHEYFRLPSA